MKNSLLIDSDFFNNFWAKVIETFNYLYNKLPIRRKSYGKLILEEAWTNWKQNLLHTCIFGSLVLVNILYKKRSKSDFWKN